MSKGFLIFAKILAALALAGFVLVLALTAQGRLGGRAPEPTPTPTATPEPTPEATPSPTPEPTPSPSPTPTPEPTPEVFTLSFVGDCTLASYPEIAGNASSFENVVGDDWAYPFSNTKRYFENDDFTIANLECTLSDTAGWSGSTFSFRAPAAAVGILTDGGVDYVTTANNHALDFGQTLYDESNAVLDAAGIGHTGDQEGLVWTTERGLKIGVYSIFNGFLPTAEQVTAGVKSLREQGAEVVIVAAHWGVEGNYYQTADQENVAHAAIDAGADIVYGSHPHRLQPAEQYNGGLILYSMANWCFGGNTKPSDMDTAIVQARIQRDLDGSISLLDFSIIPCSISSSETVNNYCPTPYEEGTEAYSRALSKIDGTYNGANSSIDYSFMHEGEEG